MHAVSFPMWFCTVQMKSRNAAREEGHMKNGWKVQAKSMDAGLLAYLLSLQIALDLSYLSKSLMGVMRACSSPVLVEIVGLTDSKPSSRMERRERGNRVIGSKSRIRGEEIPVSLFVPTHHKLRSWLYRISEESSGEHSK